MSMLRATMGRFVRNEEEGATMVEYGLMIALIAAVCVATIGLLGGNMTSLFNTISGNIPAAGS